MIVFQVRILHLTASYSLLLRMELKYLSLPLIIIHLLLVVLTLSLWHLPTTTGVVYYVKPIEPCVHNSSCPSNETCHTMDHYASNSSHYFSPDRINVTLYFICGVHNCTRYHYITVRDLQLFAMKSIAGRKNVTINMPIPTKIPQDPKNISKCAYTFTNVSKVRIENITVNFISLCFYGQNCLFVTKSVDFFGYGGPMSAMVSFINITLSQGILKDCTLIFNKIVLLDCSQVQCSQSVIPHFVYFIMQCALQLPLITA